MSKKRFAIKSQDDYWAVIDNHNDDKVCIINGIHTEIEAIWLCDFMNEQESTINKLKEELKLEQDFASRWQKESEVLAKENEQLEKGKMEALSLLGEEIDKNERLHNELQQIKEYLQIKIDECKNHKKMKEIVFGVEQAVGYEKALLQFQKGLKRRLNDE